jgi:hypothetical protein
MNKIAKFLGIITVIAPFVLIILTISMAFTVARPSSAGQHVWSEHVIVDRVEGILRGCTRRTEPKRTLPLCGTARELLAS